MTTKYVKCPRCDGKGDYYHIGVCYRCHGRKLVPATPKRAEKAIDPATLPDCILTITNAEGHQYGAAVGTRAEMEKALLRIGHTGNYQIVENPAKARYLAEVAQ